jgi:ABC-type Zn uptake system ZnuABC Zn-binding protein ZnuA
VTGRRLGFALLAAAALLTGAARAQEGALRVCTTVPDLGSLVREVGGEEVDVTVFVKGTEDPHFIDPRPSFVRALSRADLFVHVGLELESGWVPPLLQSARNRRVTLGAPGWLDASTGLSPLEVPVLGTDRSAGDVHFAGNPHYLTDPLEGLRVARLVRDRLSALRPERMAYFDRRLSRFEKRVHEALVGETLAARYDTAKLAALHEYGRLAEFLETQGESGDLGGWLGVLVGHAGTRAVADHKLWPYFARRFGLDVVGHLEPKPGIPPTTGHLSELIRQMRTTEVPLVLASPYYDPRHARFVSEKTGARVVEMAHQVGAVPAARDYLATVDYNVRTLSGALRGGG